MISKAPHISSRPVLLLFILSALSLSASRAQSQTITATAFGMQCGQAVGVTDCAASGGSITLPTEPGTLRLWDSEVQWNGLNYKAGSQCGTPPCMQWTIFDEYLNAIASPSSNVSAVIYTFGDVPCWDITGCGNALNNTAEPNPPSDLTTSGSPTFSAFVQALVTHCTTATHPNCVGKCPSGVTCNKANLIKFYELWNEANNMNFWTGAAADLYDMVSPVISTIKSNVTGAQFLTPSTYDGSGTAESWMMNDWLPQEIANGLISTYYNFHLYLGNSSPEEQYFTAILPLSSSSCATGAAGLLCPNYYPPTGTHAWKALPWINSETNFDPSTFSCTSFSTADCAGQTVRWQALQLSNLPSVPAGDSAQGASNVSWYRYKATIGDYVSGDANSTLPTDYHYGENFMETGYFNGPCNASVVGPTTDVYCPFFEPGSGKTDYWVWTNNESGSTCTVPSNPYKDYRSVATGNTVTLGGGTISSVSCAVQPILLEQ